MLDFFLRFVNAKKKKHKMLQKGEYVCVQHAYSLNGFYCKS